MLPGHRRRPAEARAQLVAFAQRNDFEVLGAVAAGREHRHALRAQIDDAAEALALAHGPGDGAAGHAQLALDFVHDVQRVAHFGPTC
jgi:phage-related baseplate assembly protein